MTDRMPLSDDEINRFVDGELPSYRRVEIEAMLAAEPALAARVMADLHVMDALRADQPLRWSPPARQLDAARRIERRLRAGRVTGLFQRGAAAAVVVLLALGAHAAGLVGLSRGTVLDEEFVEGVKEARDIANLDGATEETPEAKLARLETAIDIELPTLPPNWEVRDVSVQPLAGGQSVVVSAKSGTLGDLTLVATPATEAEEVPPTAADDGPVATVVWQSGGTAYALVGLAAPDRLVSVANGIEQRIW
jgi:anti-sigma factor RsiW